MSAGRRRLSAVVAGGALLTVAGVASAKVTARGAGGFVVEHEVLLAAAPQRVYTAITDEVSHWWNAEHSYSGDAGNFSMEARAGGCFCEQLPNGGSVEHMRVVFAAPGQMLRLAGGLGPLQGMGAGGAMDFSLAAEGDAATRLRFRYTVSGFAPGGLADLADPVDGVLGEQIDRLAGHVGRVPAP